MSVPGVKNSRPQQILLCLQNSWCGCSFARRGELILAQLTSLREVVLLCQKNFCQFEQYVLRGASPATAMVELWGRQDQDHCCSVHSLLISVLINIPHLRNASHERLLHLLTSSVCTSANISELLLWCLSWNKKPCATQMCILGNQTAKLWPP